MSLSGHARIRCQQRGIPATFVAEILDHADVDHPIGDNCRLLRVSRSRARVLNRGDRLGRYALIWSDRTGRIVTILPMLEGRRGARYRRGH
ncbi:MAG TPA: hypothetical protein GX700_07370 [Paracoccus sp.]|mgnify:CR=1 FL=1|nr:hypothetical protein [Paracoccus sp. (in: a-proteobacteria)]